MRTCALIIFVKVPRLGTVKTRFQPQLTPEQSLELYKAMGRDLTEQHHHASSYDLVIYFWPPEGLAELKEWLGETLRYRPQKGSDLGEKMHHAFMETLKNDYEKAVIIGSDLPTLNQHNILEAFRQLQRYDVVLGPTDDGGYYLIALKEPRRELFENVAWSTDTVLPRTVNNAKQSNLSLMLLDQQADVDTYAEVQRLWKQLNDPLSSLSHAEIPRTRIVLSKIFMSSP